MMTAKELGKSNIIKENEFGSDAKFDDAFVTSVGELYLEGQPVALARELVGEGTTC
jgi:hypothetical protein